MTDDIDRKQCPECDSRKTEQIDIDESRSITETALLETRSCEQCYAVWKIKYKPVATEVTSGAELLKDQPTEIHTSQSENNQ